MFSDGQTSLLFLMVWPPFLSSSLSLTSLVKIRMILLTVAIPILVQAFLPSHNWLSWQKYLFSIYLQSPGLSFLLPSSSFLPLTVLYFSCLCFHALLLFLKPRFKFSTRPPLLASTPRLPHPLFCSAPPFLTHYWSVLLSPAGTASHSCFLPLSSALVPQPRVWAQAMAHRGQKAGKCLQESQAECTECAQQVGFSQDSKNASLA